ncbi:hypothetical protein LCGC14_1952930, partial [marine sediment metagenome]
MLHFPMRKRPELKKALDALYSDYDFHGRLKNDPICLPSRYTENADIEVAGLDNVYISNGPVDGYDFIAVRDYDGRSEQIIYTIDSAPVEFLNCY